MLKYQVRTLNRPRRPRQSAFDCFDEEECSSGGSPTRTSDPTRNSRISCPPESLMTTGSRSGSKGGSSVESSPSSRSSVNSGYGGGPASTSRLMGGGLSSCPLRRKGRSTSVSSLSSASSSSEPGVEWGTIRVYTYTIRADSDYKTLFVNSTTTSEELLNMVLSKFKSKFKDPKLFYLSVEILTKHEGKQVETMITLDPQSKPMDLQQYHPKDKLRFILQLRSGVQVRVFDSDICPESNYKSILVSERTTCDEVIAILVQSHKINWPSDALQLFVIDSLTMNSYPLLPTDAVGSIVNMPWFDPTIHQIHIKKKFQDRPANSCSKASGANVLNIPISNYTTQNPSFSSAESLIDVTPKLNPKRYFMNGLGKNQLVEAQAFAKSFDNFCAP